MIPEFTFRELTPDAYQEVGLDPLPFPIRKSQEESGFHSNPINLSFLLQELASYTENYPEEIGVYLRNIELLSMTNATNQMNMGNTKGAITSLGYGLRVNPRNHSLRLHQALALQVNGQHDLAVKDYETVLGVMPYAIDPVIRAMAAKAYSAIGQDEEAFIVLDALAETAFNDPDLAALRLSLAHSAGMSEISEEQPQNSCQSCGAPQKSDKLFCTKCGVKFELPTTQHCKGCGAVSDLEKPFCTQCGHQTKIEKMR